MVIAFASEQAHRWVNRNVVLATISNDHEINTRVWLLELSAKAGRSVNLGSVPSPAWDRIADYRVDAVWLMGVWQRSPASIATANDNNRLLDEFKRALPDF